LLPSARQWPGHLSTGGPPTCLGSSCLGILPDLEMFLGLERRLPGSLEQRGHGVPLAARGNDTSWNPSSVLQAQQAQNCRKPAEVCSPARTPEEEATQVRDVDPKGVTDGPRARLTDRGLGQEWHAATDSCLGSHWVPWTAVWTFRAGPKQHWLLWLAVDARAGSGRMPLAAWDAPLNSCLSPLTLLQTTRPSPEVASCVDGSQLGSGHCRHCFRQHGLHRLLTLLQTTRPLLLQVVDSSSSRQVNSAAQFHGTVKWYIASDNALACTTC
jgi:hypothetical protein